MPKSSSPPRRPPASGPKTARQNNRDTKRRGELSELAFAHKAAQEGFGICKPYGDSESFDFILISRNWPEGDRLWRVQIKSCSFLDNNDFYHVNPIHRSMGCKVPYLSREIDFLVAYVSPDDSWFVFPLQDIVGRSCLLFRPKGPRPGKVRSSGPLEPYREAWHLLRPPK